MRSHVGRNLARRGRIVRAVEDHERMRANNFQSAGPGCIAKTIQNCAARYLKAFLIQSPGCHYSRHRVFYLETSHQGRDKGREVLALKCKVKGIPPVEAVDIR